MIGVLFILFARFSLASDLPCNEFEVHVSAHDVEAYHRQDGTPVSGSNRSAHCREIYPGSKTWAEGFKDFSLANWPYDEKFKPWTKVEKATILKIISSWPSTFQDIQGISLYRAVKSRFKNNPGASLPKANAIIVYDDFFKLTNPSRVLSHELAHIHILNLPPAKLELVLLKSG